MPSLSGVIHRRLLINYRVQPEALARLLPDPLEPDIVNGHGIGGICLIRLVQLRPRGVPSVMGLRSENAAHRIAVRWSTRDGQQQGVYIPRRDTSSWLTTVVGGRLFPGEHHRAVFDVDESDGYRVGFVSRDGGASASVRASLSDRLPASSIFASLDEASRFFERGNVGYSATRTADRLDGLRLLTRSWLTEPLDVMDVSSSFFDDTGRFPEGTVEFDCGLLMRNIEHE